MNCFELRSIDAPLIGSDLQTVEDGRQCMVEVSALIAAINATCPVDQCQVFLEVEQKCRFGVRLPVGSRKAAMRETPHHAQFFFGGSPWAHLGSSS